MSNYYFSAPGRTELGGNHTDHQHGCVLAAAVDLETKAEVEERPDNIIRVESNGFDPCELTIGDWAKRPEEEGTTAALVRGVAAGFAELMRMDEALSEGSDAAAFRGLDIKVSSTVLPGSGLSSSAAFEVLLGRIFNALFYEGKASPEQIAIIAQKAENDYFGKPCGLMDQMASSVGGVVYMDFKDPSDPLIEKIDFDFEEYNLAVCIIDSGAGHEDLTAEYAAIPAEMKAVAGYFGKDVLREVEEAEFYKNISEVRKACGDRAAMRAMHYFAETRRAANEASALEELDVSKFLALVNESGRSSDMLLQNIIPGGAKEHQELAFALGYVRHILREAGACRVHGGGFAGTIQAIVPLWLLPRFKAQVESVLGEGSCHVLKIRA